jgi:hypothetical protein
MCLIGFAKWLLSAISSKLVCRILLNFSLDYTNSEKLIKISLFEGVRHKYLVLSTIVYIHE